jgi:hypothetical protein
LSKHRHEIKHEYSDPKEPVREAASGVRFLFFCFDSRSFISFSSYWLGEVKVLFDGHKRVKKNFETEMWIDGKLLPLNHMMQETLANVLLGFSKTLKGLDSAPEKIEVKITKLSQPKEVDAHTYP